MAKKRKEAETRYWNVWAECDPNKMSRAKGQDILENRCGGCSGAGGGWDISWHEIATEEEAKTIARKAARFGFVDIVRYYQDQDNNGSWGTEVYLKGKHEPYHP